jgi:hypothetical protein
LTHGASTRVQPWIELRTARAEIDRHVESGVPSLNFDFAANSARSTDGAVGIALGHDLPAVARLGPLHLNFDAAVRSRLSGSDRTLRGALADTIAPATAVRVDDGNGRSFHLGAQVEGRLGQRWGWGAGYEFETRDDGDTGDRFHLSLGARW